MSNFSVTELAKQLISIASITPYDAGCQDLLIEYLSKLDFKIEKLPFGDVKNFWARRGNSGPVFVFAGHTDVVPTGPIEKWSSDPFQATIRDGAIYGRGAADMKGSLAAMIAACHSFITQYPNHKGSIAFLITSDEEGQAINGTAKVIEHLINEQQELNYCLVGEASSERQLGDTVKIGRRGSLNGKLIILGKQGHIAYPQLSENPIHKAASAIDELTNTHWDDGNEQFPPTTFQISNIHSGTGADNVIPGELEIIFNFRYSTASTAEQLQQKVIAILDKYKLRYQLEWRISGKPFLTPHKELAAATAQAIEEICHIKTKFSTSGGTSDGRFIATTGCQVIELGPNNASIHKIDEHINIAELEKLSEIYARILALLLSQ